jgi:hypothetical protein
MPFIRRNFGPVGGQSQRSRSGTGEGVPGVPQLWSYRSQDTHLLIDTSGYFNEVRDLLEIGDFIKVTVINGTGVLQSAGEHVVITKTATAVDVTNVTASVITNTD